MHGTEGGLNRGTAKTEIYGNTLYAYTTGNNRAIHLRSGNGVVFGNSVVRKSSGSLTFNAVFTHYRDNQGPSQPPMSSTDLNWGKCSAWGRYDLNGGVDIFTGTHTGPSNTSVLEDTNANGGLGWSDDQLISGTVRYGIKNTNLSSPWYGYEGFIYANRRADGTYKVYTLADHSVLSQDGKCNLTSRNFASGSDSQPCFATGDSYAIRRVHKCVDQAGWHPGEGSAVLASVNGINLPVGWQGSWTPFYGWNNTIDGIVTALENDKSNRDRTSGSPNQAVTIHIPNEDYYNQAGSSNRDCPSAFDGTCGVGIGSVANLPLTCSAGVAYWATDEGEWSSENSGPDGPSSVGDWRARRRTRYDSAGAGRYRRNYDFQCRAWELDIELGQSSRQCFGAICSAVRSSKFHKQQHRHRSDGGSEWNSCHGLRSGRVGC
jgi:hypothetical protein